MGSRSRKTAVIGMYIAVAMICSYIESLIPFYFGIPGVKLGLANLAVLLAMYTLGTGSAFVVSVSRIVLTGFLFGNAFSILYSLAGGLLSFVVMWLLLRTKKLSVVSVSAAGGISHNIGQILVAAAIVENYRILYYIPVLLAAGLITGLLIGILAQELLVRIPFRMDGEE